MPGPHSEFERLREVYAAMSDGELDELVASGDDFTEEAGLALRAELSRRGLGWRQEARAREPGISEPLVEPPAEAPEVDEVQAGFEVPELEDAVTIRRFRDLSEALLAQGKLEAAGIECLVTDLNMARLNWFWSNMLGGIRLQVSRDHAEDAVAVLDEAIPETLDVEGIGQVAQPRCPRCRSLDVRHESINKEASYATMVIVPIPIPTDRWKCDTCGQYWQEVPDEN